MVELCDLFPEDTSCQTGGGGTTTDPVPIDPSKTDPTDSGGDVSDEEPDSGNGGIDRPPSDGDSGDGDPTEETVEEDYDYIQAYQWERCVGLHCKDPVNRWETVKSMAYLANRTPWAHQAAFLTLSVSFIFRGFFMLFRYRSDDSFYDLAKFKNESNWWSITDKFRYWSEIVIYLILAIAQGLSMYGILPEISLWILVIGGMSAGLFTSIANMIQWSTYNSIFKKQTDETVSNFYRVQSKLLFPYLVDDMLQTVVMQVAQMIFVVFNAEGWFWASFDTLHDDRQRQIIELWEERVDMLAEKFGNVMPVVPVKKDEEAPEDEAADEISKEEEDSTADEEANVDDEATTATE